MDLDIILEENIKEMVIVGHKVDSEQKQNKKNMNIFNVDKV